MNQHFFRNFIKHDDITEHSTLTHIDAHNLSLSLARTQSLSHTHIDTHTRTEKVRKRGDGHAKR